MQNIQRQEISERKIYDGSAGVKGKTKGSCIVTFVKIIEKQQKYIDKHPMM